MNFNPMTLLFLFLDYEFFFFIACHQDGPSSHTLERYLPPLRVVSTMVEKP